MRLVLFGDGRMGQAVAVQAKERDHEVVSMLGGRELSQMGVESLAQAISDARVDAVIDFTVADQVGRSVASCATAHVPLVIGTTGWSERADEVLAPAREQGSAVLHGPNFSVGVHVFLRVVQRAGTLLDGIDDYDVYVNEAHHRHKIDHPSGTARRLADALVEEIGRKKEWRAGLEDGVAVDPSTLQVSSVRAGEIPGTHTVVAEGSHDSIELRHTARGRDGFAFGSVWAAEWLQGRSGIHTFEEALDEFLDQDESK